MRNLVGMVPRPAVLVAAMLSPLLASLAACNHNTPSGQVMARVNGDTITQRDVQAEVVAAQVPATANLKAILPGVMNAIVDRKIVSAEAKRIGLDSSPEYLALSRRADEVILGQALLEKWQAEQPRPSDDEIRDFIARNPQMFGQRKLMRVDQLRLEGASVNTRALQPLHSIDAVAQYLTAARVPFTRSQNVVDSAAMPAAMMRELDASPPGEPIADEEGGALVISAVRDTRPVPEASDSEHAAIDAMIHAKVLEKVAHLRATSRMSFQPGVIDAKPAASAAGTTQ